MSEKWAAVPGFVGEYAVSDAGRVMSMNFAQSGLPGLMRTSMRRGYPSVMMGRRQFTVHSLVASAFIGPRPDGLHINHIDGDKTNPAATNLEYVTSSENMKHAHRMGLQSNKGERHSQAKLSDRKVQEIRAYLAAGVSQPAIAKMFGVCQAVVSNIKLGKAWSHVVSGSQKAQEASDDKVTF